MPESRLTPRAKAPVLEVEYRDRKSHDGLANGSGCYPATPDQFAVLSPRTLPKCFVLFVTSVRSSASAWAAKRVMPMSSLTQRGRPRPNRCLCGAGGGTNGPTERVDGFASASTALVGAKLLTNVIALMQIVEGMLADSQRPLQHRGGRSLRCRCQHEAQSGAHENKIGSARSNLAGAGCLHAIGRCKRELRWPLVGGSSTARPSDEPQPRVDPRGSSSKPTNAETASS